ncbi:MAG: flagellar hook-associated protein FlgK [Bryobacteraceae bacterium]
MGLLTTLLNASQALDVYGQEFNTIQNNIANQNTPGYAEQSVTLVADSFNPSEALYGGISTGPMDSTRSPYLEQAVQTQTTLLGTAEQQVSDLTPLQSMFDLSSTTGISGSLDSFFNSASALSVSPNDAVARQNVITQAQTVATSFNQAASGISTASGNIEQETSDSLASINQIAGDLASINNDAGNASGTTDAGLSAQQNADLENLSEIANFTVVPTTNGQINVYLGGQTPLVMGNQAFNVSANFSTPQTVIQDSVGNNITSQITGGQLGAQIQENNTTLPGYMSSLNSLAKSFADTVNTTLSGGVDANGNAPTTNLFTYNSSATAAYTLAVTPGFTGSQIAAASASSPGGNGNALALANLSTASDDNGFTFTEAFGNLGQTVGTDVSTATNNQTEQQNLVTQAQAQRAAVSGVSLNTEAAKLLEFQESYTAVAKVVTTLNSLTDALMNMMPVAT